MFGREKRKAIKILKQQIESLNDPNFMYSAGWKSNLLAYVEKYFGKESPQYNSFSTFSVKKGTTNNQNSSDFINERNHRAKVLLQKFVEFIKHNGLYKPPTLNFLYSVSGEVVWAVFAGCIAATVWITQTFYSNKIEILTTRQEILQDSISSFKLMLSDTIANNETNVHQKP